MTDNQTPSLSDPSEQLKAIRKLREISNQKLSQLDGAINRFICRFDRQKTSLTELYDSTQKNQRYLTNVIATRDALQQTLDLLSTRQRLEPIISKSIDENFDEYIKTMNEIGQALEILSDLNFTDGKIANDNLKLLQVQGRAVITDYFISIANKYQSPFPITYWRLDDNGVFSVLCDELNQQITYPFLENDFTRMKVITGVIVDMRSNMDEFIDMYTETRNNFISATFKKIIKMVKPRTPLSGPIDPLLIPTYFRKSHSIHLLLFTYRFIVDRETEIKRKIFGNLRGVVDKVIEKSFDEILLPNIKSQVQTLNQHIDCLFDLDIIQTLKAILPTFDKYKDESTYNHQEVIQSSIQPFATATKNVIESLISAIEKHDQAFLPVDGGVSPLTSNILLFLIHLYPYEDVLNEIMHINSIVTRVITNLITNIELKAGHYNDSVLTQLFIMNNLHFIFTTVQSSKLKNSLPHENQIIIEEKIQKAQEEFIKSTWDTAFAKVNEDAVRKQLGEYHDKDELNKKQRMVIKMAFKNFRDKIDEIRQKHQGYNTKNTKLMAAIMNDTLNKIRSKYERFWSHWKDSGFSKTPEKWICYQPSTLNQMITKLYSGSSPSK